MHQTHLLIFGLGYAGMAVARAARAVGMRVTGTSRTPVVFDDTLPIPFNGALPVAFDRALPGDITHVLATAPPDASGDPVLARHAAALAQSPLLRWVGYLSTTGVYGDRGGAWVDEQSAVAPAAQRARRRVAAEQEWQALAPHLAVDLFRVAGIYGPGRSAFDDLRAGRARRIIRPGHAFGRIHRDDIAGAVVAALGQDRPPGTRVLHLADDEPAESADVIAAAATMLGLPLPPAIPYETATMSEMARSFWAENRRISSSATQAALGYRWRYPSYREGLAAILAAEQSRDRI